MCDVQKDGIIYAMIRKTITGNVWLLVMLGLAAVGLLINFADATALYIVLGVALFFLILRFGTRPLSRTVARVRYSIRWKFEVLIAGMAVVFLFIGFVTFSAMDFMHQELHQILDLGSNQPSQVILAIDELEDTQHGLLFRMTPYLGVVGLVLSAVIGGAMAWSVIDPLRRIGEIMRRIGSGDFSERARVENNDELGELAEQVNRTAGELAALQESTLAEERARALQERITQVTLAQEEERRRISRELHDSLGPSLAAAGNRLRASKDVIRTDPQRAEEELDEITRGLKGHVREIRELIYELRPLALDQLGLVSAAKQQVERFGHESGVEASFGTSGDVALEPFAELTAFRVVQECLSNVHKHADAAQVEVKLQGTHAGMEVTVQDDGRGFDPNGVAPSSIVEGVGLHSMRERAELLGGSLLVESSPGSGCRVILRIPARKEVAVGTDSSPAEVTSIGV